MSLRPNTIYCGDCLDVLVDPYPVAGSVDLIYADPPFFSQKNYEVIWGDNDEIRSFKDRWEGGINHYVEWMKPRLKKCYESLKPTGSMYLHCDSHANTHLRLLMDKIFGETHCQNEIIWQRTFAHGGGTVGFSRIHDTLLFYTKSEQFIFNRQHVPYSESYVENFFRLKESDGRRYQLVIATGSGETKSDYTWRGVKATGGRHWAYSKIRMEALEREGRLIYSKKGMPRIKQYLDEKEGALVTDLWTDIPVIHSQSTERLGYPTQKPEALLERIIKVSSNEGDLVLDPFCGCGTTAAVAKKLNRQFIGIDISPIACKLIAKRISYPETDIVGLPVTVEDLRKMKPYEFQQWSCDKMFARNTSRSSKAPSGSDKGKDGVISSNDVTGKYAGSPIQVKQSDNVGVNVVKNLFATMHGMKMKTGFIVGLSFASGAVEQVATYKNDDDIEIVLVKADELSKLKHYDYTNL